MTRATPTVDIVMGTYNGARFVAEQIRSLQEQSFADWRLIVRDDGSRDDTPAIVAALAEQDPRITIVRDAEGNLGVNQNFHRLMSFSDAPYAMYCDQDDRWLPEKIASTLARMRAEEKGDPSRPVLVHADAIVVDTDLNTLMPRFIGRAGRRRGLAGVVFHNIVQGATAMVNAALRARLLELPPLFPYDYHAAIIAEATGTRAYVDAPLLLYRQHGGNLVSADAGPSRVRESVAAEGLPLNVQNAILTQVPVKRLLDHFAPAASPAVRRARRRYETVLGKGGRLRRIAALLGGRYGFPGRLDVLRLAKAIWQRQA